STRNLRVENAEQSSVMLINALNGDSGVAQDIVALNAGAALYVSGQAKSIVDGLEKARAVMRSGAALAKMRQFIETSQSLGGR
ncbi:MAG: anthranilate phosphoribosyltransferase, partial [Arenimonas sp.]|nr:anthranilate phosphoribosyltransferase [Arenimonas sp.]